MDNKATPVKRKAEIKAARSPKLSIPMARAPRMAVKLSHNRKVRSLAKKTLGSTRVGRAMRLPRGHVRIHRMIVRLAARLNEYIVQTYRQWSGEEAERT